MHDFLPTLCVQHWNHTLSPLQVPLNLAQTPFSCAQHCSTSSLQLEKRNCIFHIALGIISKIPRLTVGTVCDIWGVCVCGHASVCVCAQKAQKSTACLLGANLTL